MKFELKNCKFEGLDFFSLTFCYFISVIKLNLIDLVLKFKRIKIGIALSYIIYVSTFIDLHFI